MPSDPKRHGKLDYGTLGGLTLASLGIIGGLMIEGGSVRDVAQVTAALIVFGGTLGAVMVTTPLALLKRALSRLRYVFFEVPVDPQQTIDEIARYAILARRAGILSLEATAESVEDPFLRKALNLAVDGAAVEEIRKILELDIAVRQRQSEAEASVYECAGAYAPTVGIIGAVLGLIQVMKHLSNIDDVGKGIAVAFVATVYGVGSANLFFLPAATKIRARAQREFLLMELMMEGCLSLAEGLNPRLIRSKLEAFAETRDADRPEPAPGTASDSRAAPDGFVR